MTQRFFLTAALIAASVPSHGQTLTNGLAAYYKEDIPGSHPDSLGASNGTPIGPVGFSASGQIAGAATFTGANSGSDPRVRAIFPNIQSWNGGTMSVWVRHVSYPSNNNYTVAQVSEANNWGHLWLYIGPLGYSTERKPIFHVGTGQGFAADAVGTTVMADNTWYHLVATWDKTQNTGRL